MILRHTVLLGLSVLLLGALPAQAFTIDKYRLGMSKKEAAAVGIRNCEHIRSQKAFRCKGTSDLAFVANVEITVGENSNKVIEIHYWLTHNKEMATINDVSRFLRLSSCAPKDTSRTALKDSELCLGGTDRIRSVGSSVRPGRNDQVYYGLASSYWSVCASYSPVTNRLQRKEINRSLDSGNRAKAFNQSLR